MTDDIGISTPPHDWTWHGLVDATVRQLAGDDTGRMILLGELARRKDFQAARTHWECTGDITKAAAMLAATLHNFGRESTNAPPSKPKRQGRI